MTRNPSRRPPARSRPRFRITLTDLMWALIGLMLTIGGTLLRASMVSPHFVFAGIPWASQAVPLYFLGVSYQIGAVLLAGCLGGKNAAVMSQIAYLTLGLAGFPVFSQGGGIQYVSAPSFGYLLGFIPGAWICGFLAFKKPPRLEILALSGLCGLFVIHLVGVLYLIVGSALQWVNLGTASVWQAFLTYSVNLLPGQLAVTCAIAVLALVLRRIMFY